MNVTQLVAFLFIFTELGFMLIGGFSVWPGSKFNLFHILLIKVSEETSEVDTIFSHIL